MNLKLRGHCFGVLLFSAIATIAALSAGLAEPEPTAAPLLPDPPSTPHGESSGGSTTTSIEDAEPLHLDDSVIGEEGTVSPAASDGPQGEQESNSSAAGRPWKRLKPRMILSTGHGAFPKPRKATGEWIYSLHSPPHGNCSKGKIKHVVQGKFYITGHLETNVQSLGYQSDAAASAQPRRGRPRVRGHRVSSPEESWQKLQPVVECGDGFMTLTVRKRRAIQLLLDRENESSVPLSQLSPQCGYSVQTSWRDLSLKAQYDACHVTQENGNFVLPLLWRGAPVRMSCPVSKIKPGDVGPSSLCCSPYGMTVKVPGLSSTDEHRVNVRGEWTPLVLLAEQCGYTLDRQGAETVIAAPFVTCGITIKDGKYTLTVETGNEVFLLACPIAPLEEPPFTYQPPVLNTPPHLTPGSTAPMSGSLEPSPWAPPFYLAPPHYPHPTFHHGHVHAEVQDTPNTPTPQALSPESTSSPRSFNPLYEEYEDHYPQRIRPGEPYEYLRTRSFLPSKDETDDSSRSYLEPKREPKTQSKEPLIMGLSEKQRSAPTGFPAQVEAPRVRGPSHDFSPYYHYYHHPKIPLPSTAPQHPDPGQEVPRESSATRFVGQKHPAMQESEELRKVDSERLLPAAHKSSHAFMHRANVPLVPKSFARDASVPPPLLQPYPYYYFYYFPHSARGEAKRLPVLHPDKAAKATLLHNHAIPRSPVATVPNKPGPKPRIHGSGEDLISKSGNYSPVLANDDVKPELEEDERRPAVQQSSSNGPQQPSQPAFSYHPNPYQYYYHHPFNDYYMMYYGPEGLFSVYNGVPPSWPKTLAYQRQDSSFTPQTSIYHKPRHVSDFQNDQQNPYFYYYHRYYQPEELRVHPELRPAGGKEFDKASSNSEPSQRTDFEYSSLEWFVHQAGKPSVPLPRLNPQHTSRQQPPTMVAQSEVKQLDNPVKEPPKANTPPPPASPCGFGPESHPECGNSVDCCFHAVQDCTVGQYFLFVVPDSVVEPTVVSPAHSPVDSNASCTLQRLTSDLDIYIVPLDGCGVNRHMFGNTVLHLLEVQGVQPYQDIDSAHQILPVRLTVGCSSSPEFPGEVMFHVMDQLPPPPQPPAAVSVQLRIATDKSFTSFYPEAHLPLSLLRSRPVYVEVGLLDPSEPNLLLLVHSCLAYTRDPYASWMLVYDGCQPHSAAQLLPSPDSHHIRRITIFSFLPLPPNSPPPAAQGGRRPFLDDPEIYFMCLTEVCSATAPDCSLSCFKGPSGDTKTMK